MTPSAPVRVWKDGRFIEDYWQQPGDGAATRTPANRSVLVPLDEFAASPENHIGTGCPVGIHVPGGGDIAPLVPYLSEIALIALDFASFGDGRNYSAARLLREKFGYGGELRAVGDVLSDQIPLMRRCGINAFAISHEPTLKALCDDALAEVSHYYQPASVAGGSRELPTGTRPWTRKGTDERSPTG